MEAERGGNGGQERADRCPILAVWWRCRHDCGLGLDWEEGTTAMLSVTAFGEWLGTTCWSGVFQPVGYDG